MDQALFWFSPWKQLEGWFPTNDWNTETTFPVPVWSVCKQQAKTVVTTGSWVQSLQHIRLDLSTVGSQNTLLWNEIRIYETMVLELVRKIIDRVSNSFQRFDGPLQWRISHSASQFLSVWRWRKYILWKCCVNILRLCTTRHWYVEAVRPVWNEHLTLKVVKSFHSRCEGFTEPHVLCSF